MCDELRDYEERHSNDRRDLSRTGGEGHQQFLRSINVVEEQLRFRQQEEMQAYAYSQRGL